MSIVHLQKSNLFLLVLFRTKIRFDKSRNNTSKIINNLL